MKCEECKLNHPDRDCYREGEPVSIVPYGNGTVVRSTSQGVYVKIPGLENFIRRSPIGIGPPIMDPELFKEICLRAQKLRDESWNGTRYTLSNGEAADQATAEFPVDKRWSQIIFFINANVWNGIQFWLT
jgi:hypothetical protein